eukprot:GFUD01043705.1.p1 GENE.GFUD01043705.1~~GFUD01043705.1.p1  ORF type:complete len:810 (-),score=102.16 GFUD01043705.1:58-2487(-)
MIMLLLCLSTLWVFSAVDSNPYLLQAEIPPLPVQPSLQEQHPREQGDGLDEQVDNVGGKLVDLSLLMEIETQIELMNKQHQDLVLLLKKLILTYMNGIKDASSSQGPQSSVSHSSPTNSQTPQTVGQEVTTEASPTASAQTVPAGQRFSGHRVSPMSSTPVPLDEVDHIILNLARMLPAENYKMPLPVTTATLPPAIVIVTNPPSFEIQQIFVPGSLIKEDDNESLLNVVRRVSAENISEIHVTQRPSATVVVPSPEYRPPTPPVVTEVEEEQSVSQELRPSLVIPEEEDIHSLLNVIGKIPTPTTSTSPIFKQSSSRTPSRVRRIRIIQTVPPTIHLPRSPPPVVATQPPLSSTVASTKYQPPFPPSLVIPEEDDIHSLLNVIGTIPVPLSTTPKFQQPSSWTPSPARTIIQTVPPMIHLQRSPLPVVSTQPPLTTTATPTKSSFSPSLLIPEEDDIHSLLNVIGTIPVPPTTTPKFQQPSSWTPSPTRTIIQTVSQTILLPRTPPVVSTQPPLTTRATPTKSSFSPSLLIPEEDYDHPLLKVIGTIPTPPSLSPKFQQSSSRTPSPTRTIIQTVPPTILLPHTPPPVVSTQPPLTTTATPTKYQRSFLPPPPSLVIPEEDDVHSLLNVIEMIPTPPSTTPKFQQPSSWTPSPTRTIIQTVSPTILLPRSPLPVISTPPAPKKDDGQLLQHEVRTISAEEYQMRSTSTVSSTEPPLTTTIRAIVPPTYQPPSLPPVPSEKVEQPPLQNVVKVTSAGNYRMFSRSSTTTPSTTTSFLTEPTTTSPSTSAEDEDDYYDLFNFLGVKYKMV